MTPGFTTPLLDHLLRGEVSHDVRLLIAQGGFDLPARESVGLLMLLSEDGEGDVRAAADAALAALPADAVAALLARSDATPAMRQFFASRGVMPGAELLRDETAPLDAARDPPETQEAEEDDRRPLASRTVPERFKIAMRGSREQRAQLIRDPNKLVATAVLSSPRLTTSEVEAFARMGNVSEDVLRIIGNNRSWVKNYPVIAALVRNPKTPPALSLTMVARLNSRDIKQIAVDRNLPEAVRLAARKFVAKSRAE